MSKKWLAAALALVLIFALAACGAQTSEPESVAETTEETVAAEPIAAGIYAFAYRDIYGDISRVSVRLNDDGSFDIMTLGAIGVASVSGSAWTDNGDGTFTTGATDKVLDVDFFGADGSVTWTLLDDVNVVPVDYVEPTEFEERPAVASASEELPENTYAWKETAFLPTDWLLEVLDDGTYKLSETNDLVGSQEYGGTIISQDGDVLVCGPLEGNRPGVDNWCTPAEGFTVVLGNGTFEPVSESGTASGEVG